MLRRASAGRGAVLEAAKLVFAPADGERRGDTTEARPTITTSKSRLASPRTFQVGRTEHLCY